MHVHTYAHMHAHTHTTYMYARNNTCMNFTHTHTHTHTHSPDLTLDQRIEYISRAVMCAKSCNLATGASTVGELLHELEEKMEVSNCPSLLPSLRQPTVF